MKRLTLAILCVALIAGPALAGGGVQASVRVRNGRFFNREVVRVRDVSFRGRQASVQLNVNTGHSYGGAGVQVFRSPGYNVGAQVVRDFGPVYIPPQAGVRFFRQADVGFSYSSSAQVFRAPAPCAPAAPQAYSGCGQAQQSFRSYAPLSQRITEEVVEEPVRSSTTTTTTTTETNGIRRTTVQRYVSP